jgi:1-acyl-sn-glycerol-3-phosphate acyltransferase
MIVANHVSWADILVLGSIGEICFVAKDEVRTMPGVSQLARLQRTVFVRREKKREAAVQADTIASRLLEGDAMVLFPEGTTGNGNKLLGFKSALFGAPLMAMEQAGIETIFVQPVAIAYNTLHGMPLGRYHQTMASWPGDIELAPHLAEFFRQGAFDVDVSLGECISVDNTATRKEITARCFEAVRQEFSKMRRLYHRD